MTDYNLYSLNKEMGYDMQITIDVEKKVIAVSGLNRLINDFILIPEEVNGIITLEKNETYIDLEYKIKKRKSLTKKSKKIKMTY
jgi:hypothetical protein